MSSFDERLVQERNRLGFSQASLAKTGGVARSAQANYEAGARSPDAKVLAAWAEVGVDVQFVVTGTRSGEIDGTMLGICDSSMKHQYLARRPDSTDPGRVRISALAKVYNALIARAAARTPAAIHQVIDDYIDFFDDPSDPALLERALFYPSSDNKNDVHADHGSQAAGRDLTIGSNRVKTKK